MNRLFYAPLGGPSGAGGNGEKEPDAFESYRQPFERFKDLTVFISQMASSGMVPNGSGWTSFLYELNEVCKIASSHLSPSPGPKWVKASERLPEKCNDVIIRVIGKPVEVAVGCVADSEEEWAVDGCSWFYYDTEWLDESPSLPGEQDTDLMAKAIQMRDAYNSYIGTLAAELFVFRGGKIRGAPVDHFKEQENARLSLSEALKPFVGGTAKTFGSSPSAEKGEQDQDGSASYEKWLDQPGLERMEQVDPPKE